MLPTGTSDDHDVFSATARKEYQWSKLSEERKKLWAAAAEKGWRAYTENSAVEVLDAKQSAAIRRSLAQRGELDRILNTHPALRPDRQGRWGKNDQRSTSDRGFGPPRGPWI